MTVWETRDGHECISILTAFLSNIINKPKTEQYTISANCDNLTERINEELTRGAKYVITITPYTDAEYITVIFERPIKKR